MRTSSPNGLSDGFVRLQRDVPIAELSGLQAKVFLAVVVLSHDETMQYSGSLDRIGEIAGVPHRSTTSRVLRELQALGLLEYHPARNQHEATVVRDVKHMAPRGWHASAVNPECTADSSAVKRGRTATRTATRTAQAPEQGECAPNTSKTTKTVNLSEHTTDEDVFAAYERALGVSAPSQLRDLIARSTPERVLEGIGRTRRKRPDSPFGYLRTVVASLNEDGWTPKPPKREPIGKCPTCEGRHMIPDGDVARHCRDCTDGMLYAPAGG